jgi:hypothetical protein
MITIRHIMIFVGMLAIGCETEKITFSGPYHVRFTTTTRTEKESYSRPVKIEVHIAGPVSTEDINVNYSIAGNARENIDYTIVGTRGVVVIEAGEYVGYIELQLLNNSNNIIRSQDIVFNLLSVSGNNFDVGFGEGEIGKKFTMTIVDDCILGGFYTGKKAAFEIPVKDILISSQDCITYRLSNWNVNVLLDPFEFALNFVDNGDNTLTVPHQEENYPLHGTGTVNVITREILLTITLEDDDDPYEFSIKLNTE